ncbi:serine protease family S33, putative [Phytophthora infestans T30-4]|uniref:Serine protease family S33, putative n=1 Tax=Phytophthora infestans (strain T30-4) TaxID=403677 RepID=D0NSC2_PHYIT|nr:serine protease family S33, putative [Phytophthora infestans T30-4]EEY64467.1 serine protease family S33, putative [Phytophthora infestans T30-4]|eukprot:XP_002897970.1 serine protease family S33, putative [Phytophthora infestans T30-4]
MLITYECGTYSAPLCYPGVCEAPKWVDQTVDIFVKRLAAADRETATNAWLLQRGPGIASNDLESKMSTLYKQLKGTVNVYTMDHRGTGRSTLLNRPAAQTITSGSPGGKNIDPKEFPSCAQALERKYGDLASFSTTSAAKDLVTFITEFSNGQRTIVYGTSYGSLLVERVIHLAPPQVTGYVMDDVTYTSRTSTGVFPYMSYADTDYGEVGDAFMGLCAQDRGCSAHFKKPHTLTSTLDNVLAKLDKKPNSTCASIVSKSDDEVTLPSHALRAFLSSLLLDSTMRNAIPPVVFRLNRCHRKDVDVLKFFFKYYGEVIRASSVAEYGINGGIYVMAPLYCAFSKEKSKACNERKLGNYDAPGIIYEHDKYWNATAKIPVDASVLLMSSKLDAQTPHKNAKEFLKALGGDNKELITFDHSAHGALLWTQLDPPKP